MPRPIFQIIQQIMDECDLKIADVAKLCGLPDSTVRGIITRKQRSIALDVAFKLSDGLKVSLEYLGGRQESNASPKAELQELLNNWDAMNDAGHHELLKQSRLLLKDPQYLACGQSGLGETA